MEKLNSKTIITVIALIIVTVLSIFVIAPFASSAKTHANSIKTLDEKKITVMELTAATANFTIKCIFTYSNRSNFLRKSSINFNRICCI